MALEQITFNIGAFNDSDAGGNNYFTNTVFEVKNQSDNTLATIYSDSSGTTQIPQNGIDNISNSRGECNFYIDDGDFYIEVGTQKKNFKTGGTLQKLSGLESPSGLDQVYNRGVTTAEMISDQPALGARYALTDRGDCEFVVTNGIANGYDKISVGGGRVAQMTLDQKQRSRSQSWGIKAEIGTPVINQTDAFSAFISDIKDKRYVGIVQEGSFLVDELDLKDANVAGFKAAGMERTYFFAAKDLGGVFVNLGLEGNSFEPTDSSIQFANFGGFTLIANGFDVDYGLSLNFFRRSEIGEVRAVGFKKSFKYNYTWLTNIGRMISQNHTEVGHVFGDSSINAVNAEGLVSSTTVSTAKDYVFENPNSLLLNSLDSEGSGTGIHFSDGRSVTLLNSHHESATHKLRTDSSSTNKLCINLIGGASFNAPEFFDMPDAIQSLTVTGFALYDIGPTFDNVSWSINAKNVVVNNFNVVNSSKQVATRQQVKEWLVASIGSNVENVSLDGEVIIVNGASPLVDQSDRFFRLTASPSSPKDIDTKASMIRRSFNISLTQRLSSNTIAKVLISGVVSEGGVLSQEVVSSINNETANIVLGYNSTTERLTIDSAFAINTKIDLEHLLA